MGRIKDRNNKDILITEAEEIKKKWQKCKKAKWLSEEALNIAEKQREAKSKEERERYTNWMQSSRE